MEKVLIIDGRQVSFKATGAFLLRYKAQFHRDALIDVFKLKSQKTLELESTYNIVWALAKNANHAIPPPMEWLDTFKAFELSEIIPELEGMIFSSLKPTEKNKIKTETIDNSDFELTTEILMRRSIERGVPLSDWEIMTVGMIVGYIYSYNNEQLDEEDKEAREASQADFDRF